MPHLTRKLDQFKVKLNKIKLMVSINGDIALLWMCPQSSVTNIFYLNFHGNWFSLN